MRVSDLAKELGITSETILAKLKSLKLKSKDSSQELSTMVIAVLKRELGSLSKSLPKAKEPDKKEPPKEAKAAKKTKTEVTAKTKVKAKKASKEKEPKPKPAKKTLASAEKLAAKKTPKEETKAQPVATPSPVSVSAEAPKKEAPVQPKPVAVQPKPAVVQPPPQAFKRPEPRPFASRETKPQPAFQPRVEVKRSLEPIEIDFPITVKDLAGNLQEKPSVILKCLMEKGILATINHGLGEETVTSLSTALGFTFKKTKTKEELFIESHKVETEDPKLLKPRPPIVTFMGHVDHGKTSLLDKIRKTKVADREHGGITQHIGAYSVLLPKGKITFLDTPGHEAFTSMRARGAHVTDLVVLVVAADEGIMPQTEEAIDHARAADVPIIVALNKIDKNSADIERVKKQLSQKELMPEDWGGKTIVCGVSAVTGEGIDNLLEMILLESEILELKANYEKRASGIIVEAKLSQGKGPVATIIVQNGTLKESDFMIVGPHFGRIKAMFDDREKAIKEAGPSTAAEILGLSGVPEAGEVFYAISDEKEAREIVNRRQEQIKNQKMQPLQRITLEDLYTQIKEGKVRELNIILKADVQGSLEAIKDSLAKIPSDEVQIKFIHTGVGEVNSSDVILAEASNAIIIAFQADINPRAKEEIEKRQVDVRTYRIIYDAINDLKKALSGLLEPKTKRKFLGKVEIRQMFDLSRSGKVAGCFVSKGKVSRKAAIEVIRNGGVVFTGSLSSLKRFKDDVREVAEGFECGLTVQGFDDLQPGDIIEAFELEKIARTL